MNRTLERSIRENLQRTIEVRTEYQREADMAKRRGDVKGWLLHRDSAVEVQGDYYWLLGDLENARRWYRVRADIVLEMHRWFSVHEPDHPFELWLTDYALALVKAGMVHDARDFLVRAHRTQLDRGERMNQVEMLRIGLAAAQIGVTELVPSVQQYVAAQRAMFSRATETRRQAVDLYLRHPWMQAFFMLGDYRACREELEKVLQAEEIVERHNVKIYASALESRKDFELAHGLDAILRSVAGEGNQDGLSVRGPRRLEKALNMSFRTNFIFYETYLVRLYLYMAQELMENRRPNPCPFAEGEGLG